MTGTLFEILGAIAATITIIEKRDFIKKQWENFKIWFKIYVIWSKKDRIKASEIRKKHQLPSGIWIKDESKIISAPTIRRRRH